MAHTLDTGVLSIDEMDQFRSQLDRALSKRRYSITCKVTELLHEGDTVEIVGCSGERKIGYVEKFIGNKLYIPGLGHREFGDTPYWHAVSKIIRDGVTIFDRCDVMG